MQSWINVMSVNVMDVILCTSWCYGYDVTDVLDQPANGKGIMSRRRDASFRQASRDVIDQCDGSMRWVMRWINMMDECDERVGTCHSAKGGFHVKGGGMMHHSGEQQGIKGPRAATSEKTGVHTT